MNLLRSTARAGLALLMLGSPSSGCEWNYLIWTPRSATEHNHTAHTFHSASSCGLKTPLHIRDPMRKA